MTSEELLHELSRQGVQVWAEGDRLRFRAPRGALTDELRAGLSQHKEMLLARLAPAAPAAPAPVPAPAPLVPAPAERFEPFPLTEMQAAYWVGRGGSFALGGTACHAYVEFDGELDPEWLATAWQRLVEHHDMLRAVVLPDGRQQVLESVPPYEIEVLDLRQEASEAKDARLAELRHELSHRIFPADRWPLFHILATRLDDRRVRVHFGIDLLIADAWSILQLFREWSRLYADPERPLPPLELSFRDCVLARAAARESAAWRRSRDYWLARVPDLPPGPRLPLARRDVAKGGPEFVRRTGRLEPAAWARLKERAREEGLTPSGVLCAAFAEALRAWSATPRFSLNVTLFSRSPLHAEIQDIVGDFTTTIPLAVEAPAGRGFAGRAQQLRDRLADDLSHAEMSGLEILREVARVRRDPEAAVLPVVFTSLLAERFAAGPPPTAWLGEMVYGISQTPQVWIDHQVFEEDGALVFHWDARDGLFPPGLLSDLFAAYRGLLARLAGDPAAWEEAPRLVPAAQLAERERANATAAPLPAERLEELFAASARRSPQAPAVLWAGGGLSYGDLDRRATGLARRLRDLGIGPGDRAAVVLEKGWEQAAAVLGILRAGAAYLPVDPGLPRERREHLLRHGEVRCAVTLRRLAEDPEGPEGLRRLCLDEEAGESGGRGGRLPGGTAGPEDLAYVVYTSGSTGLPKGVAIDHLGAVNTVLDINRRFAIGPEDRVLALSSLSFDLSVWDLFGLLAAGGAAVLPDPEARRDPAHWLERMRRHGVTVWNSVPALMEMLVEHLEGRGEALPASLRLVLLSGDWIPVGLPDRIRRLAPTARVVSLGGATEASIWSVFHPVERVDPGQASIPYGRPLSSQSFHVLSADLEPCPVWVPGQLLIGGAGVAKGYWRDPAKTAAAFVPHPETGERLYRTGDLGRYLPGGDLEILGREDLQVKIQGHRVELGEIESVLARHPSVRLAAVTVVGDAARDRRLAAYVVPGDGAPLDLAGLRRFCAERLPAYMVPALWTVLDRPPLTANGKLDRKALPPPAAVAGAEPVPAAAPGSGPVSPERVAGWIAELLGRPRLDPEADLLELGVSSVDLVRILNLLETKTGARPAIAAIYREPTAAGLARACAPAAAPPGPWGVGTPILAPEEREAFRRSRPGLRRGDEARPRKDLGPAAIPLEAYARRRSHRRFVLAPVPLADLAGLLGRLQEAEMSGEPKYLYASAGGLYPVQTYLYVKPGRVEGLEAGTWYYHPVEHSLVSLAPGALVEREAYDPYVGRPVFDEAAFSLFLVARAGAVAPLYGELGLHYATLEAGLMSQLLEAAAPDAGLGLCQIGGVDFARVRPRLALEDDHVLLHSLVGGRVEAGAEVKTGAERLLDRIRQLSDEEKKALLAARRGGGGHG